MKQLTRNISILLLLLYGVHVNASHVLGGEITYKHLKANQYKVTLNIYRDCNGCKINGTGGGNSLEDCSEIDYIYVKGTDGSSSSETKFSLSRESVTDITPICKSKISACKANSTSVFGIELQKFTAVIDLDNSKIKGFCNYYIYISIAERNDDITTGQATQNFCIDAYIRTCLNETNNSPVFQISPDFIVNSNIAQNQSFSTIDTDNDSLVYQLTPALTDIDKEANYSKGFSFSNPLTAYCLDKICIPDRNNNPPIGYYFDNSNGDAVFTPTKDGERAVVAVMVQEYRKISGRWELLGYIKRDILIYVKTSDGNNSPNFTSNNYFEICEEDPFVLKIEAEDKKNSLSTVIDTVNFRINSIMNGAGFSQHSQSIAPFNYGLFKWIPPLGSSTKGTYKVSISAIDNACPLNAVTTQEITIKVFPKEVNNTKYSDLGCGNYEIRTTNLDSKTKLLIQLFPLNGSTEIYRSSKMLDTISFLARGKYRLMTTLLNKFGCESIFNDTIINNYSTNASLVGDSIVCVGINYDYMILNAFNKSKINWFFNSNFLAKGISINSKFSSSGTLSASVLFQKGKWYCSDTLRKVITTIQPQNITGPGELHICHNTGYFDLNKVVISPVGGLWSSSSLLLSNNLINTSGISNYYDDTIALIYEITNSCKSTKKLTFILEAIPEFVLNSTSICEMNTPIQLLHLIKKPYNILDFTYKWSLENNSQYIKDDNGFKVVYPTDLGFGNHIFYGEITGKNGCKNYDTAQLEITPAIHINFKNPIILCQESGEININKLSEVTPKGGNWSFYDFQLFKNKEFILTDTCGTFEVTYVYDDYGCFDSKKVSVNIICKPPIVIKNEINKICDSELPLILSATPGGGIWEGLYVSANSFNPPKSKISDDYVIRYRVSSNQCDFKEEFKLKVVATPSINLVTDQINFCNSEPIEITGTVENADYLDCNYLGDFKHQTVSKSENFSTYTLFLSKYLKSATTSQFLTFKAGNVEGCSVTKDLQINVYDKPIVSGLSDTVFCEGVSYDFIPKIIYNGNESLQSRWSENSDVLENKAVLNTKGFLAGNHQLTFAVNNSQCRDSKTINLKILALPKVDFLIQPSNTTSIIQPEFWFLNKSDPDLAWLWNFGSFQPNSTSSEKDSKYAYSDTGNYTVTLTGTDKNGCENSISKSIVVKPDILIFIPNAFTPDNKGVEKNNTYGVTLDNYQSFSIEIFDRWGHKMYESINPTETWDGKSGDVFCTPDVYFYWIRVTSITGQQYKYKGTITLIK